MYSGVHCAGSPSCLGQGCGHLCRNTFRNFARVQKYFFAKIEDFSKIFEILLHNHPKNHFYCIFINKFHKNFKKVRKNFSRHLRQRKRVEISPFFTPGLKMEPHPQRGHPPNNSLIPTQEKIGPIKLHIGFFYQKCNTKKGLGYQ